MMPVPKLTLHPCFLPDASQPNPKSLAHDSTATCSVLNSLHALFLDDDKLAVNY